MQSGNNLSCKVLQSCCKVLRVMQVSRQGYRFREKRKRGIDKRFDP